MSGGPRRHSVSSTQMYERCPQRYYHRYVAHTPTVATERPIYLRYGSAVHAALQAAYEAATAEPQDGDMSRHEPAARAALSAAWDAEAMPRDDGYYDRAVELLQATLSALPHPAPGEVVGVERRIEGESPAGAGYLGYADLLLIRPVGGARVLLVRDWKVTRRAVGAEEVEADYQLNSLAWHAGRALNADRVFGELWFVPLQLPVRRELSRDSMLDAVTRFDADVEAIEAEEAWTPRPGEQCDDCPFRGACPAWNPAVQSNYDDVAGF